MRYSTPLEWERAGNEQRAEYQSKRRDRSA